MPAKRKPTEGSTSPDAASLDATSGADTSAADTSAADPSAAPPQADGEPDPAPLNRAERRARGKGRGPLPQTGRGKVAGGHGPAHTQRNWASRRSGG